MKIKGISLFRPSFGHSPAEFCEEGRKSLFSLTKWRIPSSRPYLALSKKQGEVAYRENSRTPLKPSHVTAVIAVQKRKCFCEFYFTAVPLLFGKSEIRPSRMNSPFLEREKRFASFFTKFSRRMSERRTE